MAAQPSLEEQERTLWRLKGKAQNIGAKLRRKRKRGEDDDEELLGDLRDIQHEAKELGLIVRFRQQRKVLEDEAAKPPLEERFPKGSIHVFQWINLDRGIMFGRIVGYTPARNVRFRAIGQTRTNPIPERFLPAGDTAEVIPNEDIEPGEVQVYDPLKDRILNDSRGEWSAWYYLEPYNPEATYSHYTDPVGHG